MSQGISIVVYPVRDLAKATKFYSTYLGVEPYVDGPYYVGFKAGDHEVGLDPNGPLSGPIAYRDVDDIKASLKELNDLGAQTQEDIKDVGYGLLVATVKDADGNIIGLRQQS
jgi:predicted enzyme related to lactoylglutathione lyase